MISLAALRKSLAMILMGVILAGGGVFADSYPPGDANGDYMVDVDDVVFLIDYIFSGGPEPVTIASADVVFDCFIDIDDAVRIAYYIFVPESPDLNYGCTHQQHQSECIEYPGGYGDSGYMVIEVIENDLRIHHFDAYYQCCLLYVVDFNLDGTSITAIESDTGEYCYCDCYFHLESTLYDLEPGVYTVTLIGIYGDTIGVDTAEINPDYGLLGYTQAGCFQEPPPVGDTNIAYHYSGDSLTMMHHDAYFNCGAGIFINFEQAGDTLRFYEIAYFEIGAAYCMCYFELSSTVFGISPGLYVAEVYDKQYPWTPIVLVDRRTILLGEN